MHWPPGRWGDFARAYLGPLIADGPDAYIDNVQARMLLLVHEGHVLPLVINETTPAECSNVCSPYAHYVRYARHELIKFRYRLPRLAAGLGLGMLGLILRAGCIDRVVYVNNWLLTTNPSPEGLTVDQVRTITERLTREFPDHAVVWRSVERQTQEDLYRSLRDCGYGMVASRRAYFVEFGEETCPTSGNTRRDLRLLEESPYEIVTGETLVPSDAGRLAELYRGLYLDKHSRHNLQFNQRYFAHVLANPGVTLTVFRREGRIEALAGTLATAKGRVGMLIGYDRSLPRKEGLYRQCMAVMQKEARAAGCRLNWSSGAGQFKLLRGAIPVVEFDAVHDRHLSWRRRAAWRCLRSVFTEALQMRIPN